MTDPTALPEAARAASVAASNFWWWVQPTVTGVSAVCAGLYARATINANRKIARTRATLDLIERIESQPFYQELWKTFRAARHAPGGVASLINPVDEDARQQRTKVFDFLNHYELVAVGCKQGVLDKDFYKNYMMHAFIRDWRASVKFIEAFRYPPNQPPQPSLFEHFEALADEWQREDEIERATRPSKQSRSYFVLLVAVLLPIRFRRRALRRVLRLRRRA